ncbi:TlpA disulfide reductase family protein [Actinoplanes sp. NPDC051851]|uniref:TlpA family protein disulfide reductase n=1 Tax=Actinoplanes sp. NPDC051851 TaxID=3154753 RepID=UPI00343937E2
MTVRRSVAALATAALLLSGCASSDETPAPFAACPAATGGSSKLPDLTLPCFRDADDDAPAIGLSKLTGPAVINIWASWCSPCRAELPIMQELSDRSAGTLTVLTVDSGDRREAAASFATDHGVTMPTLFDEKGALAAAIGQSALPATIFVSADGEIYVHRLPLDAAGLTEQLKEHLGLTVTLL